MRQIKRVAATVIACFFGVSALASSMQVSAEGVGREEGVSGAIVLMNDFCSRIANGELFATDPVIITLVCVGKTAAAGALSALLFKWLIRYNGFVATVVAAGIVPVINSGIFILGMLCITPSLYNAGFLAEGANAFAGIVIGFVGLNFVFEFGLNVIVAPALYRVINIIDRSVFTKTVAERKNADTDNKDEE